MVFFIGLFLGLGTGFILGMIFSYIILNMVSRNMIDL